MHRGVSERDRGGRHANEGGQRQGPGAEDLAHQRRHRVRQAARPGTHSTARRTAPWADISTCYDNQDDKPQIFLFRRRPLCIRPGRVLQTSRVFSTSGWLGVWCGVLFVVWCSVLLYSFLFRAVVQFSKPLCNPDPTLPWVRFRVWLREGWMALIRPLLL